MNKDAVVVCQSSSPLFTRKAFWCVAETMEAANWQTWSYTIPIASFGPWGFHLAAKNKLPPEIQINDSDTKYLTGNLLQCADRFGKDESRVDVAPNRLFEPTIYLYYIADLNR